MKKPIIIKKENAEKINAALTEVQEKCKVRTIDVDDIFQACSRIEDQLSISKVAMDGVKATVNMCKEKFPKAYKYVPEATHFSIEFKSGKWYLTDVTRGNATQSRYLVDLTDRAKAAIVDNCEMFN